MSLMSLANCVMLVENLSPPDADTAVAGDGAVADAIDRTVPSLAAQTCARQQLDAGLPTHVLYPHMSISDSRHDVASVSGLKNSQKWSRASVAQFIPKKPMLTNGH
jgi:hypothetical protein